MAFKLSKEVKMGLVGVLSLALLYWGVNFLKGKDIFKTRRQFYVVYSNTESLMPTKPVTINGFRVGLIESIVMNPKNPREIVVTLSIDYPVEIPSGSIAQIYSVGLLGEKQIELRYSNATQLAVSGDTLVGSKAVGFMDDINERLEPIVGRVDTLFGTLDQTLKTLINEENANNITATLAHLNNISAGLDAYMATNQNNLNSITADLKSFADNLEKNNAAITRLLQNLGNVSDSMAEMNLAAIGKKLESTLHETNAMMEKINQGQGTLGALVNDKQLYDNLNMTTLQLNKLLIDFRTTPKRYVHFSVFGKGGKPADEEKIERILKEDAQKLNNNP
jgi:phospholipid/cholesterol/gamma-HCH transport system substrate-binding protein